MQRTLAPRNLSRPASSYVGSTGRVTSRAYFQHQNRSSFGRYILNICIIYKRPQKSASKIAEKQLFYLAPGGGPAAGGSCWAGISSPFPLTISGFLVILKHVSIYSIGAPPRVQSKHRNSLWKKSKRDFLKFLGSPTKKTCVGLILHRNQKQISFRCHKSNYESNYQV